MDKKTLIDNLNKDLEGELGLASDQFLTCRGDDHELHGTLADADDIGLPTIFVVITVGESRVGDLELSVTEGDRVGGSGPNRDLG